MRRGLPRRIGPTYRLQLTEDGAFAWAASLVPYLARLGIQTVYLSPIAEAVPGSAHGYDGTDPTQLRANLGGLAGYTQLVGVCEEHGLGILVDWVPNHLSTWCGGPWWRRLLAEGRPSEMGQTFDVDWDAGPIGDRGKVALPLLDRPLADALSARTVRLGTRGAVAVIEVAGTDLPVTGGTVRPGDDVAEVLAGQHYRLVNWHDAGDRNYRRFFDIDGLCGVRIEDPDVFDRTHVLLGELARAGQLSGVRIDHVDGLAEPAAYLRRLAALVGVPVVVEKILTGDEQLPDDWPVAGTTGYEALDDIGGALVDPGGLRHLVAAGRGDGDPAVHEATVETRRLAARGSFAFDMHRAATHLDVAVDDLIETVVRLDRYRTYLTGQEADDPAAVGVIAAAAVWRQAAGDDPGRQAVVDAVMAPERRAGTLYLQQRTGGIMAKGIEDTAWYRLAGPLAFCEVGGDPAATREAGWEHLLTRSARRSGGLVPATTHDTKRSSDVRTRLYALTARPEAFEEGLVRLRELLGLRRDGGSLAIETRLFAQLLLGILPPLAPGTPGGGDAVWPTGDTLASRLGEAVVKGAREAELHSSWTEPDGAHEERLRSMAADALADHDALIREAFGSLVDEVARLGAALSLSAVVLRHLLPGTADCYEGDELWNLSLVDPDNRRPIDLQHLDATLASIAPARRGDPAAVDVLRQGWRDGAVKQLVTAECLDATAPGHPVLPMGRPIPVRTGGPHAASLGAVAWCHDEDRWGVAVVTRLPGTLPVDGDDLPHGASYRGITLTLPQGADGVTAWRDILGGMTVRAAGGVLAADEVLEHLPVAVLVPVDGKD